MIRRNFEPGKPAGRLDEIYNELVPTLGLPTLIWRVRILNLPDHMSASAIPDWAKINKGTPDLPTIFHDRGVVVEEFEIDAMHSTVFVSIEVCDEYPVLDTYKAKYAVGRTTAQWLGKYKAPSTRHTFAHIPDECIWWLFLASIPSTQRVSRMFFPGPAYLIPKFGASENGFYRGAGDIYDYDCVPFVQVLFNPNQRSADAMNAFLTDFHSERVEGDPWTALANVMRLLRNYRGEETPIQYFATANEICESLRIDPPFRAGCFHGPFGSMFGWDKTTRKKQDDFLANWEQFAESQGLGRRRAVSEQGGLLSVSERTKKRHLAELEYIANALIFIFHPELGPPLMPFACNVPERIQELCRATGLPCPIVPGDSEVTRGTPLEGWTVAVGEQDLSGITEPQRLLDRWSGQVAGSHAGSWICLRRGKLVLRTPTVPQAALPEAPASDVGLPAPASFGLIPAPHHESGSQQDDDGSAEDDVDDLFDPGTTYHSTFRFLRSKIGQYVTFHSINYAIGQERTDTAVNASLKHVREILNDCDPQIYDLKISLKETKARLTRL